MKVHNSLYFFDILREVITYLLFAKYLCLQKFISDSRHGTGGLTSVLNWVTSGVINLPSYMEASSLPDFPWLAYMLLCVEVSEWLDESSDWKLRHNITFY